MKRLLSKYRNIILAVFGLALIAANANAATQYFLPGIDLQTYGTLSAAATAIGSTPTRLQISTAVTLGASVTIPSTLQLDIVEGGSIALGGYTLTINSPFAPVSYKVFSGKGTVVFGGPGTKIRPQMWGFAPNASDSTTQTANAAALQACINASRVSPGSEVELPSGKYYYNTGIVVSGTLPLRVKGTVGVYSLVLDPGVDGTTLIYMGSGPAWTFNTSRDVHLSNFRLKGPGQTVSGSVGLAWTMSSGSFRDNIAISGFQTADYLGYTSDGNGSENRWDYCSYANVYDGIYLSKTQNYTNLMINCQIVASHACIRANYSCDYTVIGGGYAIANTMIGSGLYAATVTNVNASSRQLTLSTTANMTSGMQMVVEYNGYRIDKYGPKYNSALAQVSNVNSSTNTITCDSVSAGIQLGANVIVGNFPYIFSGCNFSVRGCHLEQGLGSDGHFYTPMLIYSNSYGGGSVKMENCQINYSLADSTPWNKLVPLIYVAGPTSSQNITLDFGESNVNFPYPKLDIGSYTGARIHDITWTNEPIAIYHGSGYYPTSLITERVSYQAPWGESTADTRNSYRRITDPIKSMAALEAPSALYPISGFSSPTDGNMDDFVLSRGSGSNAFLGWKQTNETSGGGYYRSESITSTATVSANSQAVAVTKPYEFWTYEFITIAGAGSSGKPLTVRIEGIDGDAKVLYISGHASTAVSGAVISRVTPAYKKMGRQGDFGIAAPSSGTWATGDIVWNTSPTAGGYAGWICTSGGTPGTWKGFGLIQTP
jgi:hypothetical protein